MVLPTLLHQLYDNRFGNLCVLELTYSQRETNPAGGGNNRLSEIWSLHFHSIDLLPSAITHNQSQVLILMWTGVVHLSPSTYGGGGSVMEPSRAHDEVTASLLPRRT